VYEKIYINLSTVIVCDDNTIYVWTMILPEIITASYQLFSGFNPSLGSILEY